MSPALSNPPSQADEAWKHALDVYFSDFIHFFYPDLAKQIDWNRPYTMLDQELLALTTEAMIGKRLVDKLVQIYTKTGQAVLLHTEIQGEDEAAFPQRLFRYYYRLDEGYGLPILPLALLTDDRPTWRPHDYQQQVLDYPVVTFQFLAKKLLDYQGQEAKLLAMTNPFGLITVAQLAALQRHPDPQARYEQKLALTRHLYDQGRGRDDFLHLYYSLDSLLTLPKVLKLRYHEVLKQMEKERNVAYITTAEEIGMERGRVQGLQQGVQQGLQQGERAVLQRLLKRRFCGLSETEEQDLEQKLTQADAETLLQWSDNLLDAQTLEQVFKSP